MMSFYSFYFLDSFFSAFAATVFCLSFSLKIISSIYSVVVRCGSFTLPPPMSERRGRCSQTGESSLFFKCSVSTSFFPFGLRGESAVHGLEHIHTHTHRGSLSLSFVFLPMRSRKQRRVLCKVG